MDRIAAGLAFVDKRWTGCLVALVVVLAALNVLAFYPGLMSNDSIAQLTQARGDIPLEDWHPPVMVMMWRMLLALTGGAVGSMLVLQSVMLWSALGLLALYVYQRSGRKWLSLLPLGLGLMPFVINISGVVWKDVQLAAALALAVVLLLLVASTKGWRLYAGLAAAGLLMAYAVNLRYNAWPALLPLLWLVWRQLPVMRDKLLAVGAIVAVALLLTPLLGWLRPITAAHSVASLMLDDVVHIYNTQQIAGLPLSQPLSQALTSISRQCETKRVSVSVWIGCSTESELHVVSRSSYGEMRKVWLRAVVGHPLQYASYRLGQFGMFLAPRTMAQAYLWHDGIVDNRYGLTFEENAASKFVRGYVEASAFDFGFLFRPYLWLLAAIGLLVAAWRYGAAWVHRRFIAALALSAIAYIAGYLPAVAAYDYRYSYWAVIAVCLGLVLTILDASGRSLTPRKPVPVHRPMRRHSGLKRSTLVE